MKNGDVFVKLNVKNYGEIRSLIVDKNDSEIQIKDKYIMCAGKYNKDGWTIVFKARSFKEAENIIENAKLNAKQESVKEEVLKDIPLDISILNRAVSA